VTPSWLPTLLTVPSQLHTSWSFRLRLVYVMYSLLAVIYSLSFASLVLAQVPGITNWAQVTGYLDLPPCARSVVYDGLNEYPACSYILPEITPYASCVCLTSDYFVIATSAVSILLPIACSSTPFEVEPVLTVAENYCLEIVGTFRRVEAAPVTTPVTG
jgi:hypothetical protein